MDIRKKELLEMVQTLKEAQDRLCLEPNIEQTDAVDMLQQCQEAAISMGTYIESLSRKYPQLVELLEAYCEDIYQLSIHWGEEILSPSLSKTIRKRLDAIRQGIQRDLPAHQKEVVFLPYKASMWDSLESVWMAANEEEDCNAYVIPIPYYDKNPDGTFRQMYYEGDQYPDYVPITHYEQYNFEEHRPDQIYIHNPYDGCNYVTTVHPFFYSENLKKFTDQLIYIPYFILNEVNPEDKQAVEGMKHFCTVPAVTHADQVIVQSEAMRQVYIQVLTEKMDGSARARSYWEKKILGLGSPKIDKVLRTKKEELSIPTEWCKVLRRIDGSWKKVIFYNTTISALLQNDKQMLEKIRSVLKVFEKYQDEIALLWRPHPLIESTLTSMRPQLLAPYREIRDQYVRDGWGIYDDTADLDRAVVLSDGYYGDWSSVVELCRKREIPIMIQNVEIRN